jgi:phosphate binding protein
MRLVAALLCCAALGLHAPARAETTLISIRVKGSDTIGERLGQELARAYMETHPEQRVEWESLGSSTAFVGLFDGSADLGASSRPVKPAELAQARAEGIELREYVIGYDGMAVIVHPSNPIQDLSIDQLSEIFAGKISSWARLGGAEHPIDLLSRPSYSGTHVFFKDVVLRRGKSGATDEFAAGTEFVEETSKIVERVAKDPDAISYVGLGFVHGQPVRVVPVAAATGEPAITPVAESVRNGSYPIYRPLYLYTRGDPQGPARELLAFILSREGQRRVASQDFVPCDVPTPLPDITAVSAGPPRGRVQEPMRIVFAFGSAQLAPEAERRLETLIADGLSEGEHFQIVGHADARGSAAVNRRMARARAEAVAARLRLAGIPDELLEIEAQGADEPLATNDSIEGRRRNRRVDVRIVDARPR